MNSFSILFSTFLLLFYRNKIEFSIWTLYPAPFLNNSLYKEFFLVSPKPNVSPTIPEVKLKIRYKVMFFSQISATFACHQSGATIRKKTGKENLYLAL